MNIPVIFLTAKSDLNDRVKGLKLGAEDYIVKPFEMVEVIARIEVVLRRYHKSQGVLHLLDIDVDLDAREVLQNGVRVDLTRKEFDLLVIFARIPTRRSFVRPFSKRSGRQITLEKAAHWIPMCSGCAEN